MDVEEIPMRDLLRWSQMSPVVRAEAATDESLPALGIRRGPVWALAFIRPSHAHGRTVICHADDGTGDLVTPAASRLLEELAGSPAFAAWLPEARADGATSATLPAKTEHLGGLIAGSPSRWEWMSSHLAPATHPSPPGTRLVELEQSAHMEVQHFIEEHHPTSDGRPFARAEQRWVGVRSDVGYLLGIGCCEIEHSRAPLLVGIAVQRSARASGIGRSITVELTRGAVADHCWSTLGMYSDNPIARRLYEGLGYRLGARWSSGPLRPVDH